MKIYNTAEIQSELLFTLERRDSLSSLDSSTLQVEVSKYLENDLSSEDWNDEDFSYYKEYSEEDLQEMSDNLEDILRIQFDL